MKEWKREENGKCYNGLYRDYHKDEFGVCLRGEHVKGRV